MKPDYIFKGAIILCAIVIASSCAYYFVWFMPTQDRQEKIAECLKAVDAQYNPIFAKLVGGAGQMSDELFSQAMDSATMLENNAKAKCKTDPNSAF